METTMKKAMLQILFLISSAVFSADITWSGNLKFTSDFIVDTLDVLTIDPGTTVQFAMEMKLVVYGQIKSNGTQADPVTFTSIPGGESVSPWGGVIIDSRSLNNTLNYTNFSYMTPLYQTGFAGMTLKESAVIFNSCRFFNNSGDSNGGAMKIEGGNVTILNSYFSNNFATDGGAIKIAGYSMMPTLINIDNCVFKSNTADSYGGAIYIFDDYMSLSTTELNITSSDFFNNTCMTGNGGAVYYMNEGFIDAEISKCRFYSNDGNWGSAIYADFMASMPNALPPQRIANLLIFKNTGSMQSGIYINMGMTPNPLNLKITNLTIAYNSIKPEIPKQDFVCGLYILSNGNYPQIENTILWKNTDNLLLPSNYWIEDYTYPAPGDIFKYCDIQNDSIGGTNIGLDPLFINPPATSEIEVFDPDKYDLHESVLSPCSNAGDPALSDPDGSRLNIGAYGGTDEAAKPYYYITDNFNIPANTAGILEVEGQAVSIDSIIMGFNSQIFIKGIKSTEIKLRSLTTPEAKFDGFCSIEPLRLGNFSSMVPHRFTITEKLKLNNIRLYNINMKVLKESLPVSVEIDSLIFISDSKDFYPNCMEAIDPDEFKIQNSKFIGMFSNGISVSRSFKNSSEDSKASKKLSNNTVSFDTDIASKTSRSVNRIGIVVSSMNVDIENNDVTGADIGICMKSGSGGKLANNTISFDADIATKDLPYYKTGIYCESSPLPWKITNNTIVSRDYLSTNITGIELKYSKGTIMYNTIYTDVWNSGQMRAAIKIMDPADTVNVVNNTIYNPVEAFFTHYSSVSKPINIINNIYWSEQMSYHTIINNTNVKFFNNCLIDTSNVFGTGNISVNPEFTSSGEGNFNLNSSSPCINAGMIIDGIHSFSEGKTVFFYGTAPDIGAFEYYQKNEYPQNLITNVTDTGLTISWDALDGYSIYRIYASDSPYGEFACIASTSDLFFTVPLDSAMNFFYIKASTDWKSFDNYDPPCRYFKAEKK
jgi:parallel beta-helix repeat protein/predicted outer membrane repeat protein